MQFVPHAVEHTNECTSILQTNGQRFMMRNSTFTLVPSFRVRDESTEHSLVFHSPRKYSLDDSSYTSVLCDRLSGGVIRNVRVLLLVLLTFSLQTCTLLLLLSLEILPGLIQIMHLFQRWPFFRILARMNYDMSRYPNDSVEDRYTGSAAWRLRQ